MKCLPVQIFNLVTTWELDKNSPSDTGCSIQSLLGNDEIIYSIEWLLEDRKTIVVKSAEHIPTKEHNYPINNLSKVLKTCAIDDP